MRIGSLFSGAGGLDMAVEAAFGGDVVWQSEIDQAASKVLAHRYPAAPNLGDITKVNWNRLAVTDPADVICGGFPCQDVSLAGRRAGLTSESRSGLWAEMARIVGLFRPRFVVIENVRGLLSAEADRDVEPDQQAVGNGAARPVLRALGAVLGDLCELGYDTQWATVAAADIGAPHRRERVFIVAHRGTVPYTGHNAGRTEQRIEHQTQARRFGQPSAESLVALLPTPTCQDGKNTAGPSQHERNTRPPNAQWGSYEPAIRHWEAALGRVAPSPTEVNKNGNVRLSAEFSSWLMGWPEGWVTDPAIGISRNEQLKIIGNGVVPQQAEAAIRYLLTVSEAA
jgi:DNA (cytosine-5)-methyltransferase 1